MPRGQTIQAQATGELQTQEKAIEGVVAPLKEALERYEVQLHQVETARVNAYSSLEEQIRALAGGNAQLQKETGSLISALRSPHVRGRWGEMTLRRAAELAGMSQHCDFTEQETFDGEDGRLRPDMIALDLLKDLSLHEFRMIARAAAIRLAQLAGDPGIRMLQSAVTDAIEHQHAEAFGLAVRDAEIESLGLVKLW